MKLLVPAALMTIASGVLYSAPVSVTCGAPMSSSVTSDGTLAADCTSFTNGYSYSGGTAVATANVSLQLADNAAGYNYLFTDQSAYTQQAHRQAIDALSAPGAEASISVSYSRTLSTGGTVRSGYLQIDGYG